MRASFFLWSKQNPFVTAQKGVAALSLAAAGARHRLQASSTTASGREGLAWGPSAAREQASRLGQERELKTTVGAASAVLMAPRTRAGRCARGRARCGRSGWDWEDAPLRSSKARGTTTVRHSRTAAGRWLAADEVGAQRLAAEQNCAGGEEVFERRRSVSNDDCRSPSSRRVLGGGSASTEPRRGA